MRKKELERQLHELWGRTKGLEAHIKDTAHRLNEHKAYLDEAFNRIDGQQEHLILDLTQRVKYLEVCINRRDKERLTKLEIRLRKLERLYSELMQLLFLKEQAGPKDTAVMKTCKNCGLSLPLSSFHRSSASKDGHTNACKKCRCRQQAIRTAEKREEQRLYQERSL